MLTDGFIESQRGSIATLSLRIRPFMFGMKRMSEESDILDVR